MRIARIIEYFPPHTGGMERHGLILTKEQIKLGYEVGVFIGVGGDLKSDFNIYKMPFQFLPVYSKIRRFWFNVWTYFTVKKHHQKNPYDVIHSHGDFVEAYFGGKLAKKLGIPVVLTIHAGLNKRLLKFENAKYFKNISKIICVSEEIANDLKSIGVPENKLAVISSGIYLIEFQKADGSKISELRNQYTKPIIISVGALRPAKGFEYLIEAFKLVKKKFSSATLLIIGSSLKVIEIGANQKDEERKKLEEKAKNITNVHFLGRQHYGRIIEYLKAADIFVLASIFTTGDREGTSNSIMEAMAAGLPVVATKVGGNPYLIKDGENGFLVEDKNSDELAKAVIKLIDNPEMREKIKIKNLEDIKQKDWPIIAKKITDVYERLRHK